MPRTLMSPNPALQQTYYRFNVYQPQSCSGEAEKVANFRRMLESLKQEKQSFLRQNTRLGRLNKGLLAAKLIKETCYSFLDLTAAFAGDILDKADPTGLSGKKVTLVATAGMGAIDMSQAGAELAYGQGSWGNVIETGTRSTINMGSALADGPVQQSAAYLVNQGVNTYDLGKGSLGGNTSQVHSAIENMSFDNASFVLEMTKENLSGPAADGVGGLKSALSTVKAARRYGQALDEALEEYRISTEDTQRSRQVIKETMEQSIARIEEALNKAQQAYNRCMRPNGSFPLG